MVNVNNLKAMFESTYYHSFNQCINVYKAALRYYLSNINTCFIVSYVLKVALRYYPSKYNMLVPV